MNLPSLLLTSIFLMLLASCSSNVPVADNTLSSAEIKDGWQLLFDGKTIDQWKNYRKEKVSEKWIIKDGELTLSGRGGGDIMTRKTYENYDLKLDWKISKGGNSGIFILADEKAPTIYFNAPEIQILDSNAKTKAHHKAGSLYAMVASPVESHKKAGEWNSVRITIVDSRLQVFQNSIKTVDIIIGGDKWSELINKSKFKKWKGFGKTKIGAIGLQDHGNVVSFKNIKIKVLN
jgi:hypothetical protein